MMAADSLKARAADIKDQCPWVSPQTDGIISYFRAYSLLMVGVEVGGGWKEGGGLSCVAREGRTCCARNRTRWIASLPHFLPTTFLHFYTAKVISHDGEGAVATGVVAGEGAPLLRPHARLTSFGGYVATGGTRFIASAPVASARSQQVRPSRCPLPTTIYHLPTTLYQLRAQIGGCQFTSE